MRGILLGASLTALLFVVEGCNFRNPKGSFEPLAGEGWYQTIHRTILDPKCMMCHTGAGAAKGVDLSNHAAIMKRPGLVVPFNSGASRLLAAIDGPKPSMPKDAPALSANEVALVKKWIDAGAKAEGVPVPVEPPVPKYSWLFKNVFQPKCLRCHRPKENVGPSGDVDFTSYQTLMHSAGQVMTPIDPGKPETSGVYDQIRQNFMPPRPPLLTLEEKQLVKAWIEGGALNN